MVKKETFTFLSNDGKTHIFVRKWTPKEKEIKAVIQITHGMLEHSNRYDWFASALADEGFLVLAQDILGHGESIISAQDLGFFDEEKQDDVLIEDMHTLRTICHKDELRNKPYFMIGHSMGSYLLRKYLTIHGEGLNGGIIMSTGYIQEKTVKMGMRITAWIAGLRGWHHRSKFIRNLTYDKYYRQYDLFGKKKENSWLTKDIAVVEEYYKDPKCTFLFTLNAYMSLFSTVLYDEKMEHVKQTPRELPLFFVAGDKDPVGAFGEGALKVYHLYKEAGLTDITWKLYEDDRHELLNETDKEEVLKDILAWLNVHIILN